MDEVWQLKPTAKHLNNNNKILHGADDQRSVSSFDTDDETNMVAAANSTRLHRLQHSRPLHTSDGSRSRPFPAHQAVLDSLIGNKAAAGSMPNNMNPSTSKSKQTQSKEVRQAQVLRTSSNGFRKAVADDKERLIQPAVKRPTEPPASFESHFPLASLRRSHSKPTRNIVPFAGSEDKKLKVDVNCDQKPSVVGVTSDNIATANCRSSIELKSSKVRSFASNSVATSSNGRRKFDDDDEYVLSPKSPPPMTDKPPPAVEQTTNNCRQFKAFNSHKHFTPLKPAETTASTGSSHQLAIGDLSPESPLRLEASVIVPPPPLTIDTSRWKRSPASPMSDVSCDSGSKVRRRFSDRTVVDLSPVLAKDKMTEEFQIEELNRLRLDLQWAKDQVALLTSHLSTNTKVVEAFDVSLGKMLQKLQALSNSSAKPNPDLNRLMDTIDALRQQNINHCIRQRLVGYTGDNRYNGDTRHTGDNRYNGDTRHTGDSRGFIGSSYYSCDNFSEDDDSLCDASSDAGGRISRRRYRNETETSPEREKLGYFKSKLKSKKSKFKEHDLSPDRQSDRKSVKNWLKNSFGRALSRIRTPSVTSSMTSSSKNDKHVSSLPSIPLQVAHRPLSMDSYPLSSYAPNTGRPSQLTFKRFEGRGHDLPSPPSGLGSEILAAKIEGRSRSNQRLAGNFFQPIRGDLELTTRSVSSLANPYPWRSDSGEQTIRPAGLELRANKRADGQHVTVSVAVDQVDDNTKQYTFVQGNQTQIPIGTLKVGDSMTWIVLDRLIKKTFEDHLTKLDPACKLGMDGESILNYQVGEVVRSNDDASFLHSPELLPIGYLVGDVTNICITLKGHREGCVDALAFELLIPKPSLSSYVHLLITHKRIILIGSSGTGKSHLARRLSGYVIDLMLNWGESSRGQFESEFGNAGNLFPPLPSLHHHHHHHHHHLEKLNPSSLVAVYRVDSQSSRELRQYLNNVAHHYQDLCKEHLSSSSSSSLTPGSDEKEFTMVTEKQRLLGRLHDNQSGVPNGPSRCKENETGALGKSRGYRNSPTPVVIVLDGLHHVTSLGDAFCGFLDLEVANGPYVIGTMQWSRSSSPSSSTSTSSTQAPSPTLGGTVGSNGTPIGPPADLQFHHNFRWIIYSGKVEPVRGFLGRYLTRCLVAATVAKTSLFSRRSLALPGSSDGFSSGGTPLTSSLLDLHLSKVIDWLPQVWQRINAYLEASSTRDITLGPRLFLSCPMDAPRAHLWFVDLWNYSIVPYLMEALKNKQGVKTTWTRLVEWLTTTMPWKSNLEKSGCSLFLNFRPEDLGLFATQRKTGSQSVQEVTTPDKARSKGQGDVDDEDDDVFNPGTASDLSLVDIVSRFQAVAIQSSSSETGSVNTALNSEVE